MTQPTAARRRTAVWIVAGIGLLVLLGVAGVVTLVTLDSGESPEPDAGQPPNSSPTASVGTFGPVPGLCEETDHFAPVFELYPRDALDNDSERDGALYQRSCTFTLADGPKRGSLTVRSRVYDEPEHARNDYRGAIEAAEEFSKTQEEFDESLEEFTAGWDRADLYTGSAPDGGLVHLILVDGVLVLEVESVIFGEDAYDFAAFQAAAAQVADNVREALRH